jgi:hypothetical protein
MNALVRTWALSSALLAALGLAPAGCAEEKKTHTDTSGDAGPQGPQGAVLDGKLAAAVKAAESAQPSSQGKGGDGDGPPESGVFGPGAADKAFPPGAPTKIELLGDGKEPRVRLVPAPADEQRETVSVTVKLQGNAIPVDYVLAVKVDKPKDEKKSDGPKVYRVAGKVAAVSLSPQLPRDLADKLGKLKGTELHYNLGADGGVGEVTYALPKDAEPALGEAVVRGLTDAIGVAMPPFPAKPVGAGAYWMVTDRSATFGVEVVRYRAYHVEKIDKDGASLSVEVREYATKDEADLGAVATKGPKLSLLRFESSGKGKLDWTVTGLLPARGETALRTGLAGSVEGQQAMLQTEVSARFSAEADKADKKK